MRHLARSTPLLVDANVRASSKFNRSASARACTTSPTNPAACAASNFVWFIWAAVLRPHPRLPRLSTASRSASARELSAAARMRFRSAACCSNKASRKARAASAADPPSQVRQLRRQFFNSQIPLPAGLRPLLVSKPKPPLPVERHSPPRRALDELGPVPFRLSARSRHTSSACSASLRPRSC